MPDNDLRKDLDETLWTTSLTGAFTPGEMGRLLYSDPIDIAHMLSHAPRGSSLRTNALLEYTRRGEWRKAAKVARCLHNLDWHVLEEIKVVYGPPQGDTGRLLDAELESLPSVVYN